MIERVKKFTIGKKSFTVNFPNIGQIIDLESLKQGLSSNRYGVMVASGVASAYYALDLIDTIAFYQIVCPEVGKYYNIENYTTLPPEKINDLMNAYTKQIKPWYDKVMQEIKQASKESNQDDGEGTDM
jgi:hypothetical protein